jgi:tetratricopeptide (TPR) repeat protein
MKKLLYVLAIAVPMAGLAQKEIKPSIQKAEKALKENKLDEAKSIIDATTTNQEYMVDKKGNPSKNAAKAWYLKGIIYGALDTTKVESFKGLEPNPFPIVKESFDKAKQIDQGKSDSFISDAIGIPIFNTVVETTFAQYYFAKAVAAYQDERDYKKALTLIEETMYFIPNDTSVLMNAGVFFAPEAGEYDKAIVYMRKYIDAGGHSSDPYIQMFSIYRDRKKNLDSALVVAQEAMDKFPNNPEFPKYELDIYIKQNKLPEARAAMQKQADADPTDKEARYFLGVINYEMKDYEAAKKWYQEAIKLDPKYFEPSLAYAELIFMDAKNVKQQMGQLGITKEDQKKRFELDKVLVEKLKIALPYYEALEKMAPDEPKVLDTLLNIYTDLDMQPQMARIEKRMKTLGLLD